MKWIVQIASLSAKILPAWMKARIYRSPKLANKIRRMLNSASPVV